MANGLRKLIKKSRYWKKKLKMSKQEAQKRLRVEELEDRIAP